VSVTGFPETPAADPVTEAGEAGTGLDIAGPDVAPARFSISPVGGEAAASAKTVSLGGEAEGSTGLAREGAASRLGGGGGSVEEIPASDGGRSGGALGDIGIIIIIIIPFISMGMVARGVGG